MTKTATEWNGRVKWGAIPERMRGGIVRYIEHGIPPGHFLLAVFSNDLVEACSLADEENLQRLGDYVKLLVNQCPSASYGSGQHVRDWVKRGGIKGNLAHEPLPAHQWSRWAV
jgi:hypothetical protein